MLRAILTLHNCRSYFILAGLHHSENNQYKIEAVQGSQAPARGCLNRRRCLILRFPDVGAGYEAESAQVLFDSVFIDLGLIPLEIANRAFVLVTHHQIEQDYLSSVSENQVWRGRSGYLRRLRY